MLVFTSTVLALLVALYVLMALFALVKLVASRSRAVFFCVLFLACVGRCFAFAVQLYSLADAPMIIFAITLSDWMFIQAYLVLFYFWSGYFFAIKGTYRRKHKAAYIVGCFLIWLIFLCFLIPSMIPWEKRKWAAKHATDAQFALATTMYGVFALSMLPLTHGVARQLVTQSLTDLAQHVRALAYWAALGLFLHAACLYFVLDVTAVGEDANVPDVVALALFYSFLECLPTLAFHRAVEEAHNSAEACTTRTVPGYAGLGTGASVNSPLTGTD